MFLVFLFKPSSPSRFVHSHLVSLPPAGVFWKVFVIFPKLVGLFGVSNGPFCDTMTVLNSIVSNSYYEICRGATYYVFALWASHNIMLPSYVWHHANFDTKFWCQNFDVSNGNVNVSNGNMTLVMQHLHGKVSILECFLIAAVEQTNKIGRRNLEVLGVFLCPVLFIYISSFFHISLWSTGLKMVVEDDLTRVGALGCTVDTEQFRFFNRAVLTKFTRV